jgi:hypothetical protein
MDQFELLAKWVADRARSWWGCSHKRTSFPITIGAEAGSETYVVCTQCGQRFGYDWTTMCKTDKRP